MIKVHKVSLVLVLALPLISVLACTSYGEVEVPTVNGVSFENADPSAIDVRNILVRNSTSLQKVPVTPKPGHEANSKSNEFRFADMYWASTSEKRTLNEVTVKSVLAWLADDANFDDQIEKRCKPGKVVGFQFLQSGEEGMSDVRSIIDMNCSAISFFDNDGQWITRTYFDPSQKIIEEILESISAL